jgi:hypothetical protein
MQNHGYMKEIQMVNNRVDAVVQNTFLFVAETLQLCLNYLKAAEMLILISYMMWLGSYRNNFIV